MLGCLFSAQVVMTWRIDPRPDREGAYPAVREVHDPRADFVRGVQRAVRLAGPQVGHQGREHIA